MGEMMMVKIALVIVVLAASAGIGWVVGTLVAKFRRKRWEWLFELLLSCPFLLWLVPMPLQEKWTDNLILLCAAVTVIARYIQCSIASRRAPIGERLLAAVEESFRLEKGSLSVDSNIRKTLYKPNGWDDDQGALELKRCLRHEFGSDIDFLVDVIQQWVYFQSAVDAVKNRLKERR